MNVALASNGATALASSTYAGCCGASEAINGERRGHPWTAGGGWNDGTRNVFTFEVFGDAVEFERDGAELLDDLNAAKDLYHVAEEQSK
jgi:hypothetical protein